MPTIDNKEIIDEIVANNGYFEGDPRVIAIVQYENDFGNKITYGVCYTSQQVSNYFNSPYCHHPKLYWDKVKGLYPVDEKAV